MEAFIVCTSQLNSKEFTSKYSLYSQERWNTKPDHWQIMLYTSVWNNQKLKDFAQWSSCYYRASCMGTDAKDIPQEAKSLTLSQTQLYRDCSQHLNKYFLKTDRDFCLL